MRSSLRSQQRLAPLGRILFVGLPLAALAFGTGCGAAAPMAPPVEATVAPAQPPGAAADAPAQAPAPPPPPPAQASRGYAPPPAPIDAHARQPSAEALAVPAMAPPAPAPPPAASPAPARPAPAGRGAVAKATPPGPAKAAPPPPKAPPPPPPRPAERAAKAPPNAPPQGVPAVPAAPLLIYVGDFQMVVEQEEMAPTLDRVIDIAESLGGYLAGRKDTSVQVRVPSARFRESLVRIEKLGEVQHRSVSADDVSEQYSDLEGRLVNLKATRHRLQEFLARAGTMADMLTVGRELERVAAEIEQIEGKMRYLRSRAAFSLVTVSLTARPKPVIKVAEKTPPPPPPPEVELPIDWLGRVTLDRLLNLRSR